MCSDAGNGTGARDGLLHKMENDDIIFWSWTQRRRSFRGNGCSTRIRSYICRTYRRRCHHCCRIRSRVCRRRRRRCRRHGFCRIRSRVCRRRRRRCHRHGFCRIRSRVCRRRRRRCRRHGFCRIRIRVCRRRRRRCRHHGSCRSRICSYSFLNTFLSPPSMTLYAGFDFWSVKMDKEKHRPPMRRCFIGQVSPV